MRPSRAARAAAIAAVLVLAGCTTGGPQLPPVVASGLPASVELQSTPFFPQQEYQCGPAALATVLVASGARVAPDDLVAEVYLPGRKGSVQAELIAAARSRGRLPYVLPPSLDDLLAQLAAGHPVLVLQKTGAGPWPGWHYAVVIGYDATRDRLVLRSGTESRLEMTATHFRATWDRADRWAMTVLEPGRLPARADFGRYMEAAAGLESVGRLDDAEQAYRAAVQHWPGESLPRLALANIALARGDEAAAERELRAALSLAPEDVPARNNLAEVLRLMGCPESARREISIAAKLAAGGPLAAAVASTQRRIDASRAPDAPGCPTD
jgi:tetratricopeptide (TPR) repeat protein